MKIISVVILLALSLVVSSCELEDKGDNADKQLYFNSFESASDTTEWRGYAFDFEKDAPPAGGQRSLRISGGCIIPHAQFTINAQPTDCYLSLRFWGKNLSNGGGVSLSVDKQGYQGIGISVSEKNWTFYESKETLFCPANTTLTLQAIAGGIIGSSILIDMIEIIKL